MQRDARVCQRELSYLLFLFFSLIFVFLPCARLSWRFCQLLSARKYRLSYRIVSYRFCRVPQEAAPHPMWTNLDCRRADYRKFSHRLLRRVRKSDRQSAIGSASLPAPRRRFSARPIVRISTGVSPVYRAPVDRSTWFDSPPDAVPHDPLYPHQAILQESSGEDQHQVLSSSSFLPRDAKTAKCGMC